MKAMKLVCAYIRLLRLRTSDSFDGAINQVARIHDPIVTTHSLITYFALN